MARRAWDAYVEKFRIVATSPVLEPAIRWYAVSALDDLLGFWITWHLFGGFEGLVEFGMHPSTVWRKVRKFRQGMGQHPDEFKLPGVTINAEEYWDFVRAQAEERGVPESTFRTFRKEKK